MNRNLLRSVLLGESRAYGFTIAFWGSGALLIKQFGLPTLVEILSYGGGAVAGFGILAVWAYSRPFQPAETEETKYIVISMIHYLAALAPIIATHYYTRLGAPEAFALAGVSVSILYNMLMLVEEWISEEAEKLEEAGQLSLLRQLLENCFKTVRVKLFKNTWLEDVSSGVYQA